MTKEEADSIRVLISEVIELAAQQCENPMHPDYVDGAWYAAQIRNLEPWFDVIFKSAIAKRVNP